MTKTRGQPCLSRGVVVDERRGIPEAVTSKTRGVRDDDESRRERKFFVSHLTQAQDRTRYSLHSFQCDEQV